MRKWPALIGMALIALWAIPALAEHCVDIELGAEVVESDPHDVLSVYFYAENCGTEPGLATFTATLEMYGVPVGTRQFRRYMRVGKAFVKELNLPIPPVVPAGTYTLCLTAELGTASDTACATVTIDDGGSILGFSNEDSASAPTGYDFTSWGTIKGQFK